MLAAKIDYQKIILPPRKSQSIPFPNVFFLVNLLVKKAPDPKHVHKRKNVKSPSSTRQIETSVCDERILSVNVLKAYMNSKRDHSHFSLQCQKDFSTLTNYGLNET